MLTCVLNSQLPLKWKPPYSEAMNPQPELLLLLDTEVLCDIRKVVLHLCSNSVREDEILLPICSCALLYLTVPTQK